MDDARAKIIHAADTEPSPSHTLMKPEPYQIAARFVFPIQYRRLRRQVREDIAHAIRFPGGGIAARVATASHNLRIQFGK
jgi:hypothetical protein